MVTKDREAHERKDGLDVLKGLSQPVSDIQLSQLVVEWVPHETIHVNKYNPNVMSYHERMLLRQSLLEDGWTQPVVTLPDRTIVDGEQRWTTAGLPLQPADIDAVIERMESRAQQGAVISESIMLRLRESRRRLEQAIAEGLPPTLASITGGLIPITRLDLGDDAHKMISTIRHNRARGVHQIDSMAAITQDLMQLGLDFEDLETRLGMDNEEIQRFLDSAESQADELAATLGTADDDFSPAWAPTHVSQLETPAANVALADSRAAATGAKAYEVAEVTRQTEIRDRTAAAITAQEATAGKSLTQPEKARIRDEVAATVTQTVAKPAPVDVRRFAVFLSPDDYNIVMTVLGETATARVLVALCRKEQRRIANAQRPAGVAVAS